LSQKTAAYSEDFGRQNEAIDRQNEAAAAKWDETADRRRLERYLYLLYQYKIPD
jgi:hypothetical protein